MEFYRRKGLNMNHLVNPMLSSLAAPVFMDSCTPAGQQTQVSTASPERSTGCATVHHQGPVEGGISHDSPSSEKSGKVFKLEDMLKYVDLSCASQTSTKPEVKKTLNELKQEKDMKGWDTPSSSEPTSGTRLPTYNPADQHYDQGSDSGSRKSSTDLSASQSSIPEMLRQHHQMFGGLGLPPPSHSQYSQPSMVHHHHQQMSHLMNQLGSMFAPTSFPSYNYGYSGPYTTFPVAASHHSSFPHLSSTTYVTPQGHQASQPVGVPSQPQPQASNTMPPPTSCPYQPSGSAPGGPSSAGGGMAVPGPTFPFPSQSSGCSVQPGASG